MVVWGSRFWLLLLSILMKVLQVTPATVTQPTSSSWPVISHFQRFRRCPYHGNIVRGTPNCPLKYQWTIPNFISSMSWGTAVVEWTFPGDGFIDVKILPKHCITKVNRLPSIKMNRLYVCLGLVPRAWATPKLYLIRLVTGAMAPGTPLWTMVEFELNLSWICMWKMLGQIVPNIFSPKWWFYGCFNTPLEHTPKPLPTGYEGTPFMVGSGDCLGCALGVWGCCNFLGWFNGGGSSFLCLLLFLKKTKSPHSRIWDPLNLISAKRP